MNLEMIELMKPLLGEDFVERYWRKAIILPFVMVKCLAEVRFKENV